ncbi:MAG: hypothetical protein AAFY02_12190 [Pseudomonadota bacterium]
MSKAEKKAKKEKPKVKATGLAQAQPVPAPLDEVARLRIELEALRLLVGRLLLVQARNMGKEDYLRDLEDSLQQDLDSSLSGETDPNLRAAMDEVLDSAIEKVRMRLLLSRADSSKRN